MGSRDIRVGYRHIRVGSRDTTGDSTHMRRGSRDNMTDCRVNRDKMGGSLWQVRGRCTVAALTSGKR